MLELRTSKQRFQKWKIKNINNKYTLTGTYSDFGDEAGEELYG